MTRNVAYLPKDVLGLFTCLIASVIALLIAVAIMAASSAQVAVADDKPSEAQLTALQLQQQIEQAQETYAARRDEAEQKSDEINANRERIAQMEADIPAQQERSSKAARELYKFQQQGVGVVELLLSSGSLHDFLVGFEYVTKVSDANVEELNRLAGLKAEIDTAQKDLEASYAEANARVDEARKALEDLEAAQAEVQRRIEEEARQAAEIAAQAAALAAQERHNDEGAPVGDAAQAPAQAPAAASAEAQPAEASAPAAEPAPESTGDASGDSGAATAEAVNAPAPASGDEAAFIAQWQPRIDAYLAGSPLAGQGATFARAAYTYNVDPRWSPAISFTESSKGAVCFRPHNAWGWGSSSWSSWEEAIDAHVGGLSRGYGYTISEEAAQKYCPPNWEGWYSRTLEQMNMI